MGAGLTILGISFRLGERPGGELDRQPCGLQDTWTFEIGAYLPKLKTTANLDSTLGPGTSISFEDDLGLDDHKINAAVLGKLRLGELENRG